MDGQCFDRLKDYRLLLRLQIRADLQIQSDVLVPCELLGITHGVLPIHPTYVRALCVNSAALASCIVMRASAVATIQKLGFRSHMYVLAAQPALGAWEGGGWRDMAVHIKYYRNEVAPLATGAFRESPAHTRGQCFYVEGLSRLAF